MADKILIVDDDEDLRSELRDFLEDYEIVEAANGKEALELVGRANDIGLVILDVKMPGISGLEVLKQLKKTDPELDIIIFTGHSSKEAAIEALKNRADDYIEKPFSAEKIRAAIEKRFDLKHHEAEVTALDMNGKLEKVKRFIQRNCFKKISLKSAAETVCLSPKYLSRIFKRHAGVGFEAYKLDVKISKAKELLSDSGLNINQIAEKLGYENAESFIRQFKRFTGHTPTAYRKKMHGRKVSLKNRPAAKGRRSR